MDTDKKFEKLKEYLLSLESIAVAFSSGVDSTFLLKTAYDVLGNKAIAVTANSQAIPQREIEQAKLFCRSEGIKHIIFNSGEMEIEGFSKNPANRCYLCKKKIFETIKLIAQENNIKNVAEGSNTDDDGDYRPGLEAVKQLGIKSPLRYAGLNKNEIRKLSKDMGLNTWDKQSFACLYSRFAYGEEITEQKLSTVDMAEQFLLNLGFHQLRVRIQDKTARIEVMPQEFQKLIEEENRSKIVKEFLGYGFTYVSMDLNGYVTGSMNKTIDNIKTSKAQV